MNLTDGNIPNQLKYEDKSQNMQAGKVKPIGDRAKSCLEEIPSPPTPPAVRKFHNSFQPEPGTIRVHYGKANDPDVASALVHGIKTKSSVTSESLLYPPKETFFQQKLQELNESLNPSSKKAPLGRSHRQNAGLPTWYNDETTFGVKTIKGQSVGEIFYSPKTTEELEEEAQEGHEGSTCNHNTYSVGQQIDRKYNDFNKDATFGIQTPHFSDGRNIRKTLQWQGEPLKIYNPNPAWKRSGTKEKLAEEIGNIMRKDILNPPPEHTFGIVVPSDKCGVGEILGLTEPGKFMRGQDEQHRQLSAVRNHLKKVNFNSFPSLLKAFQHYDQKGKGMIDKEDLRVVCQGFHLNVSEVVLDALMDFCDTNKDGFIDFVEFANFLNWKNKMPINKQDQGILTGEHHSSANLVNTDGKPASTSAELLSSKALVKPEDLESIEPGSPFKTTRTIRITRAAPDHFWTSASLIGANRDELPTSSGQTYGIRSAHSVPQTSRASDTYSNQCTAADLLRPSLSSLHGIHEEHLKCPRTKKEIAEIFRSICENMSEETFEELWKLASMKQPNGEVCVESFRNTLKENNAM